MRGSGIIRFREESDWPLKWMRSSILAMIPGFRQRIIPEPRVPSRGSQARGTRLLFYYQMILLLSIGNSSSSAIWKKHARGSFSKTTKVMSCMSEEYRLIQYRHLRLNNRKLPVTDSCLPNLKSIMRICPRMCGEEGEGGGSYPFHMSKYLLHM